MKKMEKQNLFHFFQARWVRLCSVWFCFLLAEKSSELENAKKFLDLHNVLC